MALPRRIGAEDELSFAEHLEELRQRLFVVMGAIAIGFAAAFIEHRHILTALNAALPPGRRTPATFGITEPFIVSMKVSLVAGVTLAAPIVAWQLWQFLSPAAPATFRVVLTLSALATALLVTGLSFGYFVALPAALKFLTTYDSGSFAIHIRASSYYGFALTVLVAMALIFELPLFILGLARIGAVDSKKLRARRREGYFAVCAVGVALPGVDPFTTICETLPLLVLFEASIWAVAWTERRRAREPSKLHESLI